MQVGLMGILGVAFIVLKLMEVITWSWWLVLLPLYGGIAIAVFCVILAALLSVQR